MSLSACLQWDVLEFYVAVFRYDCVRFVGVLRKNRQTYFRLLLALVWVIFRVNLLK